MRRKKLLAATVLLLVVVAVTAGVYAFKYANDLADQRAKFHNSQAELKNTFKKIESLDTELEKAKQETQKN